MLVGEREERRKSTSTHNRPLFLQAQLPSVRALELIFITWNSTSNSLLLLSLARPLAMFVFVCLFQLRRMTQCLWDLSLTVILLVMNCNGLPLPFITKQVTLGGNLWSHLCFNSLNIYLLNNIYTLGTVLYSGTHWWTKQISLSLNHLHSSIKWGIINTEYKYILYDRMIECNKHTRENM